ncbi:hypothetical protein V1525DRAFT_419747 [Lipomyces kononenkoae]|uniref:Uncharacterized protein n=1 Tax=Lipomyces kononenkoae TaxID=34357 RepID=A0ACC3SZR4_LIPKO
MAYSLYDATVVMAKGALTSLDRILSQAEKHPNSAGFFTARLTEDMKPLTFQVHYAAFTAEAVAATLSGREYIEPDEDLDSYEKMHARIDQALKELDKIDKETVNRVGETTTYAIRHEGRVEVPVKALVCSKHMPNIYFHVAMAYAILRMEGVPLGKRDWSRAFVSEYA